MKPQSTAPRSLAEVGAPRAEAARRLGVHVETVRRYVNAGLLNQVKVGPTRVVITWESLERMLQGRD